jgi:glycosyltransferase involved in cell wall biosynthesis
VRVLIDYRPALRARTGAGEYTHQLVRALSTMSAADASGAPDGTLDLSLFSSSWKDRLTKDRLTDVDALGAVSVVDRRVPVAVLNFAWHRLGWPPAELVTGSSYDVTHSSHPLILPARRAAHVVTIHDLDFLSHPEHTRAEVRRDYPGLAPEHARRADRVLVPSLFTAGEVERRLQVPRERIVVCPPGAPAWTPRSAAPRDGYVLFVGTLEPRKNVGGLLDAYERVIDTAAELELLLVGSATDASRAWLERIGRPPLKGKVRHVGYVDASRMRQMYEGARVLVMPSFDEGFGIPVLDAMTLGVPVVAARRGSLPEVLGDAGRLVDPEAPAEIADAILQVAQDDGYADALAARGVARSRAFRWDETARRVYGAYRDAVEHHAHRR